MKEQKCKNCKCPIPKGKEKYIKAMKVCERCFFRLKKTNRMKISNRESYLRWLQDKH